MKIFISGSKTIGKLTDGIKYKLKGLAEDGHEILIGDCYGIDAAVQKYYAEIGYKNVTVYASGDKVRNNIGGNKVVFVPVKDGIIGYEFYKQKDLAMANNADCGIVIWDGKTRGSQSNFDELAKQNKPRILVNYDESGMYDECSKWNFNEW